MNPTARNLARRVAQELGQPTNHPGTARLARDLADALTRPVDPAPHDPELFDEATGPMPTGDAPRPRAFSSSERPDCDFNNAITGGAWLEYDAAADWCSARGIRGTIKDPLPENLSNRAMELINIDPDAFERRVREHAYLRSMTGSRHVRPPE